MQLLFLLGVLSSRWLVKRARRHIDLIVIWKRHIKVRKMSMNLLFKFRVPITGTGDCQFVVRRKRFWENQQVLMRKMTNEQFELDMSLDVGTWYVRKVIFFSSKRGILRRKCIAGAQHARHKRTQRGIFLLPISCRPKRDITRAKQCHQWDAPRSFRSF